MSQPSPSTVTTTRTSSFSPQPSPPFQTPASSYLSAPSTSSLPLPQRRSSKNGRWMPLSSHGLPRSPSGSSNMSSHSHRFASTQPSRQPSISSPAPVHQRPAPQPSLLHLDPARPSLRGASKHSRLASFPPSPLARDDMGSHETTVFARLGRKLKRCSKCFAREHEGEEMEEIRAVHWTEL